jgi:hypothetical protein
MEQSPEKEGTFLGYHRFLQKKASKWSSLRGTPLIPLSCAFLFLCHVRIGMYDKVMGCQKEPASAAGRVADLKIPPSVYSVPSSIIPPFSPTTKP